MSLCSDSIDVKIETECKASLLTLYRFYFGSMTELTEWLKKLFYAKFSNTQLSGKWEGPHLPNYLLLEALKIVN